MVVNLELRSRKFFDLAGVAFEALGYKTQALGLNGRRSGIFASGNSDARFEYSIPREAQRRCRKSLAITAFNMTRIFSKGRLKIRYPCFPLPAGQGSVKVKVEASREQPLAFGIVYLCGVIVSSLLAIASTPCTLKVMAFKARKYARDGFKTETQSSAGNFITSSKLCRSPISQHLYRIGCRSSQIP
jgi:hypothetical protein